MLLYLFVYLFDLHTEHSSLCTAVKASSQWNEE